MKKIIITIITALLAVIACMLCLAACGGGGGGKYYRVKADGEIDKHIYLELKSGKWSNEEGDNGTYKKNGENITFYITFFGETEIYDSGTLKDNVLKTDGRTFISEKHSHKYGEWETDFHATCVSNGQESRTCACGVRQKRDSDEQATGHTPSEYYSFDDDNHYMVCSVCSSQFDKEQHYSQNSCSKCGYPNPVVDGIRYALNDSGLATIYEVPADVVEINIPAKINYKGKKYDVTALSQNLSQNAFSNCDVLSKITVDEESLLFSSKDGILYNKKQTVILQVPKAIKGNAAIPDGVEEIGSEVFYNRIGLTGIIIPNSVTSISSRAFLGCSGLQSISVGSENSSYHSVGNCLIETASKMLILGCKNSTIPNDGSVVSIGSYAFRGCSELTNLTIPDSVTSINSGAFQDCEKLIKTENGVQYVDKWVVGCDKSTESAAIKDSMIGIAARAFCDCNVLTTLTIPDSVKYIGIEAFGDCSSLTSINIPKGLTIINSRTFSGCSNLKSITIPDSVTRIGDSAFSGCSNLESITVPDGVTRIERNAFAGCKSLTNVIIADSVTRIGSGAFSECPIENAVIPANAATAICSSSLKTVVITSGTSLVNTAFSYCRNLESVTLPDSITSIGYHAFGDCYNLTAINYNGTLEQWRSIEKHKDWAYFAGNYTVICTDGKLDSNGIIITE